jgi:hypothetical protein
MPIPVNISVIAPALQQMVAGALRDQFEQETATYTLFEKADGPEFVNGKGFRVPSYLRPPVGVHGISEGGSFNQPGAETYDDMFVYPMNMSMAFELTGKTLRNAKDESSMIKGLNGLMEKRMMALKKEANRQVFNDGSGLRAVVDSTATATATTITFTSAAASTFGQTKGARHLEVGETYDVYDSTLATYKSTVRVLSKTGTTATINAGVSGGATADVYVLSNSLYKMPRGLAHIVNNDTGTFQLQSRNTYPQLRAVVTDLNGAAISVQDFTKTKNLLISRAGVGKAKTVMAINSLAQDDALRRLGQNFKRWDGDAKIFDGSFDKFQHGDTVEMVDPDCDEDRVYLVVKSEIKKYPEKDLGLYDEDGNELRMRSGSAGYGSDSWTGALGGFWNWGCEEPRLNALIKEASITGLSTQVLDAA